ncbi:MAG: ATP-binding cassette domain-containing protein, partial [Oscillospiraceae bacterium]|nr:ATP-binding cassette domain-containing protein [Oscillospiraceae bacterium]
MDEPLLEVRDLKKYFNTKNGVLHAVDGVSVTLASGKTLGVVGESGCGKSTLGRTILGLSSATSGQVMFCGEDITYASKRRRKELCQDMQIIFQDPYSSLNPRRCVSELIEDPLKLHHMCSSKEETKKRVHELMDTVGLAERFAFSYPHELDGGRR